MAEFMNLERNSHRKKKNYKLRRYGEEDNFKALFRFSRENVNWLSEHFLGVDLGERRGGALTNVQKMQTFPSDPGFQVRRLMVLCNIPDLITNSIVNLCC